MASGVLKSCIHAIRGAIIENSASYDFPQELRLVSITSFENGCSLSLAANASEGHSVIFGVNLILLSASDGRDSIVELTKTLALAAQRGTLASAEVTLDLVASKLADVCNLHETQTKCNQSSEKNEKVRFPPVKPDPDLLISFAQCLTLEGYPPWQLRLTEIFCTGDYGMKGKGLDFAYKVFIKALYFFAGVEMRFGK